MVSFGFQGLLSSGPTSYMTGISDSDIRMSVDGPVLYAASGPDGGISCYRLTAGGPQFLGQEAFELGQIHATTGQTEEITLNGQDLLVTLGRHDTTPQCFDLNAAGQITGTAQLTPVGGFPAAIVSMEQVSLGGEDFIYTSHFGIDGIVVYAQGQAGQLQQVGHVGDTGTGPQSADMIAMHGIDMGANSYLLTLSALDNALVSYRLGADGIPVEVDRIDSETGLSISQATGLATAQVEGVQYLVVAAAGSGSLSVLEMTADGSLMPTDHVIDDLNTRFQGVTALETVTVGDQVFVVAGGADDGLSLFSLLPGGRLLHRAKIADDNDMSLTNITALSLTVLDGVIHVFATGEAEAGITHLTVDPGAIGQTILAGDLGGTFNGTAAGEVLVGGIGNDKLRGHGGDDILIDGAGSDNLRGGEGADVFVLVADGVRDTIEDFEFGIDRLDLSGLGLIHSLAQLSIVTTVWGAKIFAGDEEIRLYSKDGLPLDDGAFGIGDFVDMAHYPLARTAAPEPTGGTAGDDWLLGSSGADTLSGLAGNDRLEAGAGADLLEGDSGHDTLLGEAGDDTLDGDNGNDVLDGGDGNDVLQGGGGNDILEGKGGNDDLIGGKGRDWLAGGSGDDRLQGDSGSDVIYGNTGADTLYGNNGHDQLYGGTNGDLIFGGAQNDQLYGEIGNDTLIGGNDHDGVYGGLGDDALYGNGGIDLLDGGGGNDLLNGGWFSDQLYGGADNDTLYGEGGHDRLFGGTGNDRLFGQAGNDRLFGANQDDTLYGGAGDDTLHGEGGRDVLHGDTGDDVLTGGWFSDRFAFGDGFGQDTITDFDANNLNEVIDLRFVSAITDLADLVANHLRQAGSDVVIDDGVGNMIVVQNVTLAEMQQAEDYWL